MSAWKPGDVAMVGTQRWMRLHTGDWINDAGSRVPAEPEPPARRLVVIDPESDEGVARLRDVLGPRLAFAINLLSVWQNALREFADPTPPKPEEPTGLGAVIEDAAGTRWVRHDSVPIARPWLNSDDCEVRYRSYADINAVRVLSEGVTTDA